MLNLKNKMLKIFKGLNHKTRLIYSFKILDSNNIKEHKINYSLK